MMIVRWNWRRIAARVLTGLILPCCASSAIGGEPLAQPAKAPPVIVVQEVVSGLPELRNLALEKQPALAAYRSSAAAAEAKSKALDAMRLASVVRPDLHTRRLQAEQGVLASHAQLRKGEYETLYAVTRTYLSVLYAREQLALADRALDKNAVTSLTYLRQLADDIYMNKKRPDVKKWNVDQLDVLILTTTGRREEAFQGVRRAEAALREAIGLEADCPLIIDPKAVLKPIKLDISKEQAVSLALDRRGEVLQSAVGLEVTSLEIKAQHCIFGPRGETFAAGTDLHVNPVPQGIANGDYRPGAITVEMPAQLVGSRKNRIEQAEALQGRAAAVMDKTRHLVTLEAEDAYYKWLEASREAEQYSEAAKRAKKIADDLAGDDGFKPADNQGGKPTFDELVDARVRAVQLQLQANASIYRALLALAALERITSGGINPGFDQLGK